MRRLLLFLPALSFVVLPSFVEPRPVGGPDAPVVVTSYNRTLGELQRKEEILQQHLATLARESQDVQRQVRALTTKRSVAASRGDRASVAAVDQEIAGLLRSDADIAEARRMLERLRRDREAFAAFVHASQTQFLASQVAAVQPILTEDIVELPGISLLDWPVTPMRGLSSTFHDEGYRSRFGIAHEAIDIPTAQGTPIRAPRDGVVVAAVDNGYGYSYIDVQHGRNLTTRYGHVSGLAVREGQVVRLGDLLGLTGGRPGSRGAGFLTTGPHLHFEVVVDGRRVDPLALLPRSVLVAAVRE